MLARSNGLTMIDILIASNNGNACIVCLHVGPCTLFGLETVSAHEKVKESSNVGSPLYSPSIKIQWYVVDIVKSCPVAIPSARASAWCLCRVCESWHENTMIKTFILWNVHKATPSDTLVSGPPPASDFILSHYLSAQNKCDNDIHLQNNELINKVSR